MFYPIKGMKRQAIYRLRESSLKPHIWGNAENEVKTQMPSKMESRGQPHIAGGMENGRAVTEVQQCLTNLNMQLSHTPATALWDIYRTRVLIYAHIKPCV